MLRRQFKFKKKHLKVINEKYVWVDQWSFEISLNQNVFPYLGTGHLAEILSAKDGQFSF